MNHILTRDSHRLGVAYGILSALAFTTYLILNRYVYLHYDVSAFNYTATFLIAGGGFAFISLILSRHKQQLIKRPEHLPNMILNGLVAAIAMGLLIIGQRYTTAVNASIIAASTTLPTILFSRLMLRESLKNRQILWVLVMFVGLYFAIVGQHLLSFRTGDLIILSSIVFFGFANTFSKVLMKHNPSDIIADVRLITGSIIFIFLGLFISGSNFLVTSAGLWPVLGGFAFWLTIRTFYASIHYINPNRAVVLCNSHPIITPILGVWLLSEPYSLVKAIGSIVLLISIYTISKK